MSTSIKTIGLGGGCHWCTEAVFQSLKGVTLVEQGYISAIEPEDSFSEAVIVHYDPQEITLAVLIEIHLLTHKSTSNHSMRDTYRSAIYAMDAESYAFAKAELVKVQSQFEKPLVTIILHFAAFKASRDEITDYYRKNPAKPFCERYITPKLKFLMEHYSEKIARQFQ